MLLGLIWRPVRNLVERAKKASIFAPGTIGVVLLDSPEVWRPIPGYEGHYEVSNLGRVRSLDRYIETKQGLRFRAGCIRKFGKHVGGYLELPLLLDGKQKMFTVHRLVMLAFVGERPEGFDICHNDGDKTNNELSNLRYDTKKSNAQDSIRHGTNWQLSKTSCVNGHEFTVDNTGYNDKGQRWCKACRRAQVRAHYYNNPEYYKARSERRRTKVS
ncbi:NUMOD4 motif-containing HNH endonuclease [Mycobacteroides abscessus]|uniref:NUMOD4 motif-containing HNH endonuclease n=1 Tax=Mycobacteroides abscessus TaxID=36809 RepID=UPI003B3B1E5F